MRWVFLAGLLLTQLMLSGCGSVPGATPTPIVPQLRLTNISALDIAQVVVRFPNERITFGPVPAGATTAYQPVQGGVYRYAAYEATVAGETIVQPVMDWMGEEPLPGVSFTYVLLIDPQHPPGRIIQSQVQQD